MNRLHLNSARYSYVYRMRYTSRLGNFINFNSRRLVRPRFLSPRLSPVTALSSKTIRANLDDLYGSLPFETAFQVQALVSAWQIMPSEVFELHLTLYRLDKRLGAAQVKALGSEMKWRDPRPGKGHNFTTEEMKQFLLQGQTYTNPRDWRDQEGTVDYRARLAFYSDPISHDSSNDDVLIHSVTITPAGVQLSGPHRDSGNRVLRKFPGMDSQYLRVSFRDETGEQMRETHRVDSGTNILRGRFLSFLNHGLIVAGLRFVFLAFSSSQLRSHSCWFVREPLELPDGRSLTAQDIRDTIGDLSGIRCPARFAARLGQAFTTTVYSIKVPKNQIYKMNDHKSRCKKYNFTDGVGTISSDMAALLNSAARKGGKLGKGKTANVFQIRMDGAKGVVALDSRLRGLQIHVRESMIKYYVHDLDAYRELAVAKADSVPGACFLNRPLIALLESLDVPFLSFKLLQDEALAKIERAANDPLDASRLLHDNSLGVCTRISSTLNSLCKEFNLSMDDIKAIPFLRGIVRAALLHSLRAIKYKARIPVQQGYTLMGVVDETNTLGKGEVYVSLRFANGEHRELFGSLLVTRSPTLHPGDVQVAKAVGTVPQDSPLSALTNCIVFSQRGKRPLPSMLGGGDLDGDLYNIIQDSRLFPAFAHQAAEYAPIAPVNLGRPVETGDITSFFIDYIIADKVGMLANRHLTISDQVNDGVCNEKCTYLASLYSTALDYPKTGVLPNLNDLPKTYGKPDYMESEYRIEQRLSGENPANLKLLERDSGQFYRSKKALGKLFRSIETPRLVNRWGLQDDGTGTSMQYQKRWQATLLHRLKPVNTSWKRFLPYHRILVDFHYREEQALKIAFHTGGRSAALTSAEVFLGCTSLKSPYQTRKQLYDLTESLQTNYRDMVARFLQAASSPPGAVEESNLAQYMREMQLDHDDDVDYDDSLSRRTQAWARPTLMGTLVNADDDEERRAIELHMAMYSLFKAALDHPVDDSSQMSCPWVVYPRLVAAQKNADRLSLYRYD